MALEGSCIFKEFSYSETETQDQVIVNSDGVEETVQVPVETVTETPYEYAYVVIKQVSLFQIYGVSGKKQICLAQIAGYNSSYERDEDQENYLFWTTIEIPYNYDLNLYSQCYDYIKTVNGFENLTDC